MGRVRTKTVKRSARQIVERYFSKLSLDFQINKQICADVCRTPSKRMRNKIAGFVTHLMRRIDQGQSIRGVSLQLQEEERERRMDYVPKESELRTENLNVDKETEEMLKKIGVSFRFKSHRVTTAGYQKRPFRPRGERRQQASK